MTKLRLPSVAEAAAIDIPLAGRFLALNRVAAYRAAKSGFLPVVQVSERRWKVPVAALRALLGLPIEGPALDIDLDPGLSWSPEVAKANTFVEREAPE